MCVQKPYTVEPYIMKCRWTANFFFISGLVNNYYLLYWGLLHQLFCSLNLVVNLVGPKIINLICWNFITKGFDSSHYLNLYLICHRENEDLIDLLS